MTVLTLTNISVQVIYTMTTFLSYLFFLHVSFSFNIRDFLMIIVILSRFLSVDMFLDIDIVIWSSRVILLYYLGSPLRLRSTRVVYLK